MIVNSALHFGWGIVLAGLNQSRAIAKLKRFGDSSHHKKSLEIETLSLKYSAKCRANTGRTSMGPKGKADV
jgi:hypothetical protein